jgi:hypothetical protein
VQTGHSPVPRAVGHTPLARFGNGPLLLLCSLSMAVLTVSPVAAETVVEAWRGGGFDYPAAVSVNPVDGSCWVGELAGNTGAAQVVHLSASGAELLRVGGFFTVRSASVNPTDGSCWVADWTGGRVAHLGADGTDLWHGGGFQHAHSVCVDPTDGSCWVASVNSPLTHLSSTGAELWQEETLVPAWSVSVDPTDSSCWVARAAGPAHLSASGDELWQGVLDKGAVSVSVNPTDGSCWAGNYDQVVHFTDTGDELWRSGESGNGACLVAANPKDGSCWVAYFYAGRVAHLSAEGAVLWQSYDYFKPEAVAVNPVDGSCWVADAGDNEVVHLVVLGDVFPDINCYHWAGDEIEACSDAGIVQGYPGGNYGPSDPVTRAQMAVYIARALVIPSGDAAIPDPGPPARFSDVPADYWAYPWIEYAVSAHVIQGYPGGAYHPDEVVNRGQMAVYVARAAAGGDEAVPEDAGGAAFSDVTETNEWAWCYRYVEYCAASGVVQGYADGTYRPHLAVSRDQMAVYIARAFDLPM